jgi:hypothetical protein
MQPHRSRSTLVLAAVVTVLLTALCAGMALASSDAPPTGPPVTPAPGSGYGYGGWGGYGYGGGGGGYGYGGGGGYGYGYEAPIGALWDVPGTVSDAGNGGAAIAGASVTLQRQVADGPWTDVPAGTLRPAENPQRTSAQGRFVWLIPHGPGRLRVVATAAGYAQGTSAVRVLAQDGNLDVALTPVPATGGGDGGAPAPGAPVGGTGPVAKPVAKVTGCAAKKGTAKAACLRAEALAKALKACRSTKKGSRRTTCERRARALSACDAKTGKRRTACRKKALAIGHKRGR